MRAGQPMTLSTTQIPIVPAKDELSSAVVEQVQHWVLDASQQKNSQAANRLSGLLQDSNGLDFAVGFVDGVIRPESLKVAAKNLYRLRKITPKFLPWILRAMVSLGANLARPFPWIVIPIARKVLRSFVAHLVIDATPTKLSRSISRLSKQGSTLNVNLLGEAVLGNKEADRRLQKVKDVLSRPDVDYVSVKVSAIVSPHSPWSFNETVSDVIERLTPLYRIASESKKQKFINLDMEEYHDLDMTVAVFKGILSKPEFTNLQAGIVLQAYLPDAVRAMIDIQQFAASRVFAGGAPVKVRVVKGANLPMERVDAESHGWPLATVESKAAADANYKRVLNYALTEERVANVRIGVAGHNLFDLAFAWLLASQRNAQIGMDFEMLLGMAEAQANVIRKTVGTLVLYTPVVHPQEFDVAIAYLIRRLEEGASKENFLSNAFRLTDPDIFQVEEERFRDSLSMLDLEIPIPNRLQDRRNDVAFAPASGFANAADTDPSLAGNRAWGYEIIGRAGTSDIGLDLVANQTISSEANLQEVMDRVVAGGARWANESLQTRATKLHEIGVAMEANRGALIEVAMAEAGKTIEQADTEISEAVDFAHYYAQRALELDKIDGASPVPFGVTVVTPPWNFPIAIPAGGALAALAAGSAVIFKPAGASARCGAVLADIISKIIDQDVFVPVQLSESGLGKQLLSHPKVDQVILTGGYETAQLFRGFRPDLRLLAETSGKNAIIVTESADYDLAAKDIAYSAFGHAGQKCSASSLVILVGSVHKSKRFLRQLHDAVSSMHVGHANDPRTQMGPMIAAPAGKLLEGLTQLGRGEKWLLEPSQLDETGKLWSPGIRVNVVPNSTSHLTEYFGPILSIMIAPNLEAAIALQNSVDYGLTTGIHSLDAVEIEKWLAKIQAGNLYVNRGITGAIVQRQPFGGWKRSSVGPSTKAGGPNYILSLTNWKSSRSTASAEIRNKSVNELLAVAQLTDFSDTEMESLVRAAKSDQAALTETFSNATDPSNLDSERNVLRYRRSDCVLRIQDTAGSQETMRALSIALVLGSLDISAFELDKNVMSLLKKSGLRVAIEDQDTFERRLAASPRRVRLVGGEPIVDADSAFSNCDVAVYSHELTESGRIELLPFFKEQSVTVTGHRFGTPVQFVAELSI
ncbi:MAG: 1-pyrroline-5-carboxylate dehydrogenase [Microbacteriaceae bacterium BACL28 MAG-120531-bin53]|jgi:RHH-type transcriptional regulator, proline utilization regulon repressor / proline dehydrogenase / delta 1-pyrroline-5-carboxylate dehydrogenase|nr:MAG: 1-pyrroline-5-carboxylate dehydrogenase [Microbacteriaceae bacterium BACL28 MAG-120531-bin53]